MIFVARYTLTEGDVSRLPLLLHIGATTMGLSLSSTFHLLSCTSEGDFKFFQKLDYVGILTIASGTIISPLHYGFICEQHKFWRYLWISSAVTGCGFAAITTMSQQRPIPWVNGLAWFCAGIMGCPGFIQLGIDKHTNQFFLLTPWLIGFTFIASGMAIYALRVPERFCP